MPSYPKQNVIALLLLAWNGNDAVDAFSPSSRQPHRSASASIISSLAAEGFAPMTIKERRPTTEENSHIDDEPDNDIIDALSADEAKRALTDLVPRMTGSDEDYRAVESYVNLLENKYSSIQTLDFLNLAMAGEWQLLFSTNLMGRPNRRLRLTELVQKIEADGFGGRLINTAMWDYVDDDGDADGGGTFDANGAFMVKCSYEINQGARMVVDLDDHELRPAKGSKIPGDVPGLVGLLHRAIPKEMFDPNGHAMDTTYLDADLRIVRLTGPHHEGVRNIFMRKGILEIKPM